MNPTPTSVELAAWLGCLAFCVALFNQLAKTKALVFGEKARTTEVSPQPLEVRMSSDVARERDCVQRHEESTLRLDEVRREIDHMREERSQDLRDQSESRKALYERIEKVERELLSKMDGISDQVVTRMVNTKQLWKQ